MRIISNKKLVDYYKKHKETESQLKAWYHEAKKEKWNTPQDVKEKYGSASIIGNNRVVFNIKGNAYRLVAKFHFEKQWVFIKFIGTHVEYDKIDVNKI